MKLVPFAAAATVIACAVTPMGAAAAAADQLPAFSYRDCPPLPSGVDQTRWRCEDHVASGTVTIGRSSPIPIRITSMTHAEGPLADGSPGQVFAGLHGAVTRVPGGFLGLPLAIQPESAGSADLITPGGIVELKFRLVSPLLGRSCTLGSHSEPVKISLGLVPGSAVWVSQDPPIRRMDGTDTAFAVPRASGCGPLGRLIDQRFGLPAPSGTNTLALRIYYSYKTYDALPAA